MADRTGGGEVEILERGNIYFFYRPAVGEETPKGLVDVQRFHFVLSPERRDLFRMITVGKKRLPEPDDAGQRFWGFVEKVGQSSGEMVEELERGQMRDGFGTKRSARPAGEGVYALARHGNHTHLLYTLELPVEPDEVQRELHIEKQGSYLLSVKNPAAGSPPSVGLEEERKAEFPEELQERFGSRRFIALESPEFLDYEGAELLVMGSDEGPAENLDVDLKPECESEETANLFQELDIDRERHPVEPLLTGKWA
jgi:hypothetical protein